MARNNDLVVTAGLNIEASVAQIEKDLKQVNDRLSADHALKIIANVDLSKTTQRIQSQLTTISKNLNLDIGGINLNTANINNSISQSVSAIKAGLTKGIDVNIPINSNAITDFADALSRIDDNIPDEAIKKLSNSLDGLLVRVTKIKPAFTQLAGETERSLSSLAISGIDKFGNLVNYVEKFDLAKDQDNGKSTITITQNLAEIEKANKRVEDSAKAAQIAYNDFLKLKGQADVYAKRFAGEDSLKTQLTDIQQLVSDFDNTQSLEKQREGIIKIDNALKVLKVDIDNIQKASTSVVSKSVNDYYPSIAKIASTDKSSKAAQLDTAKTTLNDFFKAENIEDSANRIKRAVEDTSGELQRFYVQVEKGDKSVETLTYALNEQGSAYEYLGKTIREADNSTDFRRKDITTQWDIQTQKLQQFITNAEKAGAASTVLSNDIANLKNKLNDKGDTSAMNSFLDDFDIAKAKFQAFNAEVRKDNAITNFNNKIKKLSADMNAYATTNQRAVESTKKMTSGTTFADEWVRLTGLMAKGANLTDTELRNLIADMAVFKKESKSAGLEGASAFERFANSFKVISTYISANQIINRVISQIREGITELKEIDNILTEISKTSDRTSESLRRLGQASFDVASSYGRTASDYLLGVQEMSRAGFGEVQSEQLAELSLRAQAAGDMTAEMANQYIIATNAAYGLEGNIDALNKVLDSQNYITNRNALNMENLSEATKTAASQASASGVAIDELTAAVGTMVATTQQGGNIAGRALKGILMNIQQVKADAADIGDGGEAITTESLSKYEAATKALGVSLKEVKNGVWALRDPMQVLKELSEAVRKESEDSVKIANLISSVGGKYRGNQLIALLQNWDTYEKMLSEFNSDEAVGSAMEEAEKSANNWSGSLNKLKNSWAEFANKVINSDEAIKLIQSLNTIIQNLTESVATGALKTIGQGLNTIVQILAKIIDKFDVISPLITSIFVTKLGKAMFNGKSVFGTITDEAEGAIPELTLFGKKIKDIKNSANEIDGSGVQNLGKAFSFAKLEALALNAAITVGATVFINGAIKLISSVVNKAKEAAEAEEQLRKEQEERRQEAIKNISAYEEEANVLTDLSGQYVKLVSSTEDISSVKDDLISIQDQLLEKYDDEANAIDLVNGSLSEQLELLQNIQKEDALKWLRDNAQAITDAENSVEEYLSGSQGNRISPEDLFGGWLGELDENEWVNLKYQLTGYLEQTKSAGRYLVNELKDDTGSIGLEFGIDSSAPIEEQIQLMYDLADAYGNVRQNLVGYDDVLVGQLDTWRNNLVKYADSLSNSVQLLDKTDEIKDVVASYRSLDKSVQDTFNNLADQMQAVGQKMNSPNAAPAEIYVLSDELNDLKKQMQDLVAENPALQNQMNVLFKNIGFAAEDTTNSIENLKAAFIETFDDIHKGALSDIEKIEKAMQTLAEGDYLDFDAFKELVWNIDSEGIIQNIKLVDNQYKLSAEELIKLKDSVIKKQIERIEVDKAEARSGIESINKRIAAELKYMATLSVIDRVKYMSTIGQLREKQEELGNEIKRDNQLIKEYNRHLGDTTDIAKALESRVSKLKDEVSDLTTKADNLLKAQQTAIDNIVKGIENEKKALESEKDTLQEQLDILNAQKDELDEIIDNYKRVSDVVADSIDKEIKAIEDERKSVEEYYDGLIEKLHTQNEEREDAIELAEKQAQLENAKNNKVRIYDSERGWHYETDLEAVTKAENDLASFENDQEIKALERQKDEAIAAYDKQIEAFEEYKEDWTGFIDEMADLEDEELARQILGEEYREKLKSKDMAMLNKFKIEYKNYNTQLDKLVKGEIETLNSNIEAINKDIELKQKQINSWNEYKNTIEAAASGIKGALDGYGEALSAITLNENSSYEERQRNLENFVNNYKGLIDQISAKNGEIDAATEKINNLSNAGSSLDLGNFGNSITEFVKEMFKKVSESSIEVASKLATATVIAGAEKIKEFANSVLGFSTGGVNDYTGLAMLHGTKSSSEVIFNASQAKKLYNYIEQTPDLLASATRQAARIGTPFTSNSKQTTNNKSITFEKPTIVLEGVQNPADFARQMDGYLQMTITESNVNK